MPRDGHSMSPAVISAMAAAMMPPPTRSIRRFVCGESMMPRANHSATISAGITTRNAQRQPNSPPITPPKAGATDEARLVPVTHRPIARA